MATMKAPRLKNEDRPVIHKYAEVWLAEAVELLRPMFNECGYEIPPVHVSVGFSTFGYNPSAKKRVIAVCHAKSMTRDGINEIYITPLVYEPVNVLGLLVHELIHAVDDCRSGHGKTFQEMSLALKCSDNLKVPLSVWREALDRHKKIADQLGRYPRSGVNYADSFNFEVKPNKEALAA